MDPDVRSDLIEVLKMAVFSKLVIVWTVYFLWIALFVNIADWVGIWRAVLTKDTLLWSATAGVALLIGSTEASEPGYFRRAFSKVLSVVVIFEYLVNFTTFPVWIEIPLQLILFLFVVAPVVTKKPEQQEAWRRIRTWFFIILMIVIGGHTVQTLHASWQAMDLGLLALQAVWPMLLGIWVLMLLFPLSVVMCYEQAFVRLEMYRNDNARLWKLGLVLALRIRLKWIREAAEGGSGTYHVAHAESVSAAYEAAKCYRTEDA